MDIRQNIVNKIGCAVAWWILHNCSDGLAIKRKGGAEQVIKVFSVQAYRNIIKPLISPEHQEIKAGDVVTAPYHGKECRKNIQVLTKINGVLQEIQEYKAIGTVEECQKAMERQNPKKPAKDKHNHDCCPNCGWIVYKSEYGGRYLNCCENCGQAVDWPE